MLTALIRRASFLLVDGRCVLCGANAKRAIDLCPECEAELPVIQTACPRCGVPMLHSASCLACMERPPAFDRLFTRFLYRSPVDRMMIRFKQQGHLAIGHVMAELTAAALGNNRPDSREPDIPDLLVPVPLTARAYRKRGFNQARMIADIIGAHLGVPVGENVLQRRLESAPQKTADRQARLAQVRGAFEVTRQVDGLHAGLVDDVVTTGATAQECARLLRRAGAARVTVIAIARTPPPV